MKRLLAIMVAAAMLVACGGEKKKELTVEEQVKAYYEQLEKVSEDDDAEAALKLRTEMETWYDGLSEEDKAKAYAAIEECEAQLADEFEEELTVEEQAKAYFEHLLEALNNADSGTFAAVMEESEAWYNGLSEEDKAKADAAIMEYEAQCAGEFEEEYEDDLGCEGITVGEMAEYYATQMLEALNNADSGAFAAVMEESDAWYEALDECDQQIADNVVAEYEQEMMEAMMKVADDPDFAAIFAE